MRRGPESGWHRAAGSRIGRGGRGRGGRRRLFGGGRRRRRGRGGLEMTRRRAWTLLALLVCAPAGFAQKHKKGEEGNSRSVKGSVTAPDDTALNGAVVALQNTKNL